MRDGGGVGSGNVRRHERDLHPQRLRRGTGMHGATREAGVAEGVGRKSQRGGAGLEFAVGGGLIQIADAEPERLAEEGASGGDAGDVENGAGNSAMPQCRHEPANHSYAPNKTSARARRDLHWQRLPLITIVLP